MSIMTIGDLKNASPEEVQHYLRKVTLLEDLEAFERWLGSAKAQPIDVRFDLGPHERKLGVHPSAASKVPLCPLAVYYGCTGEVEAKKDFDLDREDTFSLGTAWHTVMQTKLKVMFEDQFRDEVPLRIPELHVIGHCDGLFTFSDYRFILEIKTIKDGSSPYAFPKALKQPQAAHVRQLTMYMRALDVPFGLIFYFCKNDSKKKEWPISFDSNIWAELENAIRPVVSAAYKGGPPVVPKAGSTCRFCDYAHGCEAGRRIQDGKSSRRSWR